MRFQVGLFLPCFCYFYFGCTTQYVQDLSSPDQKLNLYLMNWKYRVLSTGPQKSLNPSIRLAKKFVQVHTELTKLNELLVSPI